MIHWHHPIKKLVKPKILLVVPTFNSENYIAATEKRMVGIGVDLLFAINGKSPHAIASKISSPYIIVDGFGKNNAMNAARDYAASQNYEYIHFVDDDVVLSNPESLWLHAREDMIVGSRMTCQPPINDFQNIISLPYSQNHPFVSGQSFVVSVATMPEIPPGIADDAFLSCWYAVNGKVLIDNHSELKFKLAIEESSWTAQKVRNYVNIERAESMFSHEGIKSMHWAFSFQSDKRATKPKDTCPILYAQLTYLFDKVERFALDILKNNESPPWSVVEDSKYL